MRPTCGATGRPRIWWPLPTYLFACFWFVLFTIAGWMMASLAGDGDRFNVTVRFSMFGAFWLAFLIATLSQFAINDGNYYEAVNAAQNLLGGWRRWRRYHTCLLLAASVYGAIASAILPAHIGFSQPRNWGPIPLESWLMAGTCYLALAAAVRHKAARPERVLGFPRG